MIKRLKKENYDISISNVQESTSICQFANTIFLVFNYRLFFCITCSFTLFLVFNECLPQTGPTDLSVKGASKPSRPTLNAVEVAAVRQLITGYRESAAFLLRSADELENLLIHQQSP